MLGSLVLMALSLGGDNLQVLCDDQHVTTKVPHAKTFTPLTVKEVTSTVAGMPAAIIQELDLENILKRMHITGKVAGHYMLDAKKQTAAINVRGFRSALELCAGGGDVFRSKDSIELRAVPGPIPSSLCVRLYPGIGPTLRFLVIFQVSAVEGLGPRPRVFVGETGSTLFGPGTTHPLKTGAYATLFESPQFLVGALLMRAKSGAIKISQVDVYRVAP